MPDSSSNMMDSSSAISAADFIYFPSDKSDRNDSLLNDHAALTQALLTPSNLRDEAGLDDNSEGNILFIEEDLTVHSGTSNVFAVTPILRSNSDSHHLRRRFRRGSGNNHSDEPELNGLNYLNVVTYVLHLFVSWGVGVWGLDGFVKTRIAIGLQYETLMTPAKWAYTIWYPILVLEAVFAIAQLFPDYRGRPIVQAGTGYFFFYIFCFQTAWTLFFAFELFICSFVAVNAALFSLLSLLASQQASRTRSRNHKRLEYYFFQFPFFLHTGWMIVVTLLHFTLMFRSHDCSESLQLAVNVVCLALLLPVALVSLAFPNWKDFVIPIVIIWSYSGIACQLGHPTQDLVDLFGDTVINALRIATFFFIGAVACCLVPNVVVWVFRECCTIHVVELE